MREVFGSIDRRAGDAERVDVAAGLVRNATGRPSERVHRGRPELASIASTVSLSVATISSPADPPGRLPIERLGVEVAGEMRRKAPIEADMAGPLPRSAPAPHRRRCGPRRHDRRGPTGHGRSRRPAPPATAQPARAANRSRSNDASDFSIPAQIRKRNGIVDWSCRDEA